ncbi:hypothetical protein, partial [Paralcaligenes ureilyticus]|uniref:hypothetical protein n=1 Tax=Paralcaligenes ureilyticus TaxID=627131 RepID=UPI001A9CE527
RAWFGEARRALFERHGCAQHAVRGASSHAAPNQVLRAGSSGAARTVPVRARTSSSAHGAGLEGF